MGGFQRIEYRFKHRLRFLEHLIIPKPQHPESAFFDLLVSTIIVRCVFQMLTAIQFDHQPCLNTGKIDDIAAYRDLATETEAGDLPVAEKAPEVAFGIGCLISQGAPVVAGWHCAFCLSGIYYPLPSPPPR